MGELTYMLNGKKIEKYLAPGRHVHLVGIGGVSMRPLGLVLKGMGMEVTGSDMNASVSTDELIGQGIPVAIGHRAENIRGADCIIRTAAAHNDNPEIAAARAAGIPVFERAQAWGEIMKSYKNAVCISGTHGKTTTTSMMTHILMEADLDPTVMIGGYLPLLHAGHRVGHGDTIVLESCEYCDSFLNFFPTLAVVLNVEADHLDYFKDLADIQKSFHKFASLATFGVVANGDDPHTVQAMEGIDYVSFGLGEGNRIHAANMHPDWRHFDVICDGEFYCHMDMGVLGKHNAMNALAAAAAAWMMGIPGQTVSHGIESFHGAGRRMEFKGKFNGADIYDDYAHHPDELAATIDAVRSMGYKRVVLAFQPHTYSRTKALFDDFVRELKKPDVVVLAEIYAARERNTIGISSSQLAQQVPGAVFCETLPEVTDFLRRHVREGDIVVTMGAGDIFRAGEALLSGEQA
ncbi:MAG: UDP-N-acetylmuramate--L-alanine ligase [Faecousia sp.]